MKGSWLADREVSKQIIQFVVRWISMTSWLDKFLLQQNATDNPSFSSDVEPLDRKLYPCF